MSTRAVPFHCPYCGDEDLEPYEGELNTGGPAAAPNTAGSAAAHHTAGSAAAHHTAGSAAGAGWYCRACARAFKLKFLGIGVKI
ncbi:hypothetical protein ETD86_47725 [Nonomuraea turkmeniaca]|uniref:Uncharacterized protein n=1 Tax=Nonomuraea turkmeniaca TaxID=103838 RepID=A0A5S4EY00_9ACTN|nr:hypothetical protein [Nonomuraea turkmeniaca]TMR08452.1 hypothetical protein ETD86_47725 [Nonomuraea turkmeniaca]